MTSTNSFDDGCQYYECLIDESFEKIIKPFHLGAPVDLREMMVESGAIISGSGALAMLHPDAFKPNELDFYVRANRFSPILRFMESHGYKTDLSVKSYLDYDCDALLVLTMFNNSSSLKINIVVVSSPHVIGAITDFHSTLLMNYVAWYGVVSLYPNWTMERKGLIVKTSENTKKAFAKYHVRGFKLYEDNKDLVSNEPEDPHYCKKCFNCPKKKRCLHDIHCAFGLFQGLKFRDLTSLVPNVTWSLAVPCGFTNS